MSHFSERHPPMGSEKDLDISQTVYNTDDNAVITQSSLSSSDELDELSLRVKALLSETVDDLLLNPFHQEHQQIESSQHDQVNTDVKVSCTALDFKCSQYIDLKSHPKNGDEICCECSFKDVTVSDKAYFDANVEIAEVCKQETESGVLTFIDAHNDVLQIPNSPRKIYEHDNSKGFSYSVYGDPEKDSVNSGCLQNLHHEVSPFTKDASPFTCHCPYFLTSEECTEQLSVHNINNYPVPSTAVTALQPFSDKDDKEFLWSKCSDYDTPPLSASSIASSKRLEWDNAADIGYNIDTVDNTYNNYRKGRREPEGYSSRAEISTVSLKHTADLRIHLSANKLDSNKLEKKENSQISHPCSDTIDIDHSKISDESKNFNSESYDEHDKNNLLCGKEPSCSLLQDSDNSLKELSVQKSDSSVRPKDKICIQASRQLGRKSAMHKNSINSETEITYSKSSEEIQLEENKRMQDENSIYSKETDILKKKVSFVPGSAYTNIDHSQKEIPYSEQYKSHIYKTVPSSVEYYSQIMSAPLYIDNDVVSSQSFSGKSAEDNAISNPESFPHIRWYPLPPYNSQDIKNASSQTSLPFHQEHMTKSPESVDNTDVEFSFCDETLSCGTQTQTNENLKRDVGFYPHVIENLSYENVILSIQRNTNEIFSPLTSHILGSQFEDEKEDNSVKTSQILLSIKKIFSKALRMIPEEEESEVKAQGSSMSYAIIFTDKMEICKNVHTAKLKFKSLDRFKYLGQYDQNVLKKFCKKKEIAKRMEMEPEKKLLLMENLKKKKQFSKVVAQSVLQGKLSFSLYENILVPKDKTKEK